MNIEQKIMELIRNGIHSERGIIKCVGYPAPVVESALASLVAAHTIRKTGTEGFYNYYVGKSSDMAHNEYMWDWDREEE